MPAGGKRKNITSITVQEFLERHGKDLELVTEHPVVGLDRKIEEPSVNRPGLALSGFFTYFAKKRIQVLGNSEISYLKRLEPATRLARFTKLCEQDIPCIVIARNHKIEAELMSVARDRKIAIITSPRPTMSFLNKATVRLECDFAPRTTLHGCMVDYRGIGVLIMGKSGAGKSETAIGLLEKGAALVADDSVLISQVGGELTTRSKDFARGYLEMRGIGIINVANLYGLSAIRPEKRLDLVVDLRPATDLNKVDRLGIKQKKYRILDIEIPLVEIPVAPGRDTARLIGVAALDLQLRRIGYDMADEFNRRLLEKMADGGS
ncbi:MAG: HPr(Ser) kinase/phosphatase [Akkermansiaceae bacterium]|jgi:HPr kinase/phosphorylase